LFSCCSRYAVVVRLFSFGVSHLLDPLREYDVSRVRLQIAKSLALVQGWAGSVCAFARHIPLLVLRMGLVTCMLCATICPNRVFPLTLPQSAPLNPPVLTYRVLIICQSSTPSWSSLSSREAVVRCVQTENQSSRPEFVVLRLCLTSLLDAISPHKGRPRQEMNCAGTVLYCYW
jgi:hypothetical protein